MTGFEPFPGTLLTLDPDSVSLTSAPGRGALRVPRAAVVALPAEAMSWTPGGSFVNPVILVQGFLPEPLHVASFDVVGGWPDGTPKVPGVTHTVRREDWQELARFFGLPVLPLPSSRRHGDGA